MVIYILLTEQVQELKDNGYLNDTQVSNIDRIESEFTSETEPHKVIFIRFVGMIKQMVSFQRYYKCLDYHVDNLSVNFPLILPKYLYETYTSHVEEPITIYDSSSGWGGRIIESMSMRKKHTMLVQTLIQIQVVGINR